MATDPDKLAQELSQAPNIVVETFAEKMAEAAAKDLFSGEKYDGPAQIAAAEIATRQADGRMK